MSCKGVDPVSTRTIVSINSNMRAYNHVQKILHLMNIHQDILADL